MQKVYFHNGRYDSEKKVEKESIPLQFTDKKNIVDINKLLNRVKIDKKNETKRKIIFTTENISVKKKFKKKLFYHNILIKRELLISTNYLTE